MDAILGFLSSLVTPEMLPFVGGGAVFLLVLVYLTVKKRKNTPEGRSKEAASPKPDPKADKKALKKADKKVAPKPEKPVPKESKSWFAKKKPPLTPPAPLAVPSEPPAPLAVPSEPPAPLVAPPQVAPPQVTPLQVDLPPVVPIEPPQAFVSEAGLKAVQLRAVNGSFSEDTQSLVQAHNGQVTLEAPLPELILQPQAQPVFPTPEPLTPPPPPQLKVPVAPPPPPQPVAPSPPRPTLEVAPQVAPQVASRPTPPRLAPAQPPQPVAPEVVPTPVASVDLGPTAELVAPLAPVAPLVAEIPQTVELTVAPQPVSAPPQPQTVELTVGAAPTVIPTVQIVSSHDVRDDLDDLAPPPPPKPVRLQVRADQTQMTSPIQIDQTQMPKSVKSQSEKKAVTIQELDVNYDVAPFMSPLEIVYYKLLRSALNQYLIFPHVICRSVVKAISSQPEHQKIADNVLSGTSLSFIVCDVKLKIKAVVEVIDESKSPTNKDKARNYILKKVGFSLLRFYSGDKPPDPETIRRNILG